MQPQLDGDIGLAGSASGSAVTGTVDVEDSLGLGEESSPYLRADIGAAIVSFTVSAFHYDATGNGVLEATFGEITAGTPVSTDMEILNIKGAATFNLIDLGPVRLAPGIAIDYLDVDTTVTSTSLSAFESVRVQAPVPMLFGQGEVVLGPVAAILDVGWMSADLADAEGTWWDIEGMLRMTALDPVELIAGYRWISADVDGTADGQNYSADLVLQGWFVGGGLSF
jgi:hypothetical protein